MWLQAQGKETKNPDRSLTHSWAHLVHRRISARDRCKQSPGLPHRYVLSPGSGGALAKASLERATRGAGLGQLRPSCRHGAGLQTFRWRMQVAPAFFPYLAPRKWQSVAHTPGRRLMNLLQDPTDRRTPKHNVIQTFPRNGLARSSYSESYSQQAITHSVPTVSIFLLYSYL